MRSIRIIQRAALAALLGLAAPAAAQMPDLEALASEQRDAMGKFAWLDGEWRGTATVFGPGGSETLTQTERVGTMVGGTVRVVEGRGYDAQGNLLFNAFGTITYDAMRDRYVMATVARGMTAQPWFALVEGGFDWGIDAGPVKITYETRLVDGVWIETGFQQFGAGERVKTIEMRLERIGDSDWPAAGAVGPDRR